MNASAGCRSTLWPTFFALLVYAGQGQAQPIVYQATGTKEQIEQMVRQFDHDIVYGVGGDEQHSPPTLGSFQTATLDDLNSVSPTTYLTKETTSGGLSLLTAGAWFAVSAGLDTPANPNRRFGDLDPAYPSVLQPFSSTGFGALVWGATGGSDGFSVLNMAPGKRYSQNAFGGVFMNVTSPAAASLVLFLGGVDPGSIGKWFNASAPVMEATGEFSFVGVISPDQPIQLSLISMQELLINPAPVAVDDIILGQTPPIPEPSPLTLILAGLGVVTLSSRLWTRRMSLRV
jgi:hypothetical protein